MDTGGVGKDPEDWRVSQYTRCRDLKDLRPPSHTTNMTEIPESVQQFPASAGGEMSRQVCPNRKESCGKQPAACAYGCDDFVGDVLRVPREKYQEVDKVEKRCDGEDFGDISDLYPSA